MNSATYIKRSLLYRPFTKVLQVMVLALGVASLGLMLSLSKATDKLLLADIQGIDLVVGAKGSPLQLILSAALHLDMPTGNIPVADAEKLKRNPLVKNAIPIALGDNLNGYRIIGTSKQYPELYKAELAEGRFWEKPMEAVIGSDVAAKTGLQTGQAFAGAHGLVSGAEVHDKFPYTIVGILKPTGTVMDRLILTGVNSVWNIHSHHGEDEHDEDEAMHHALAEYTALLVQYKTPLAMATLPREINRGTVMQAASPAMEMARLYRYFGRATDLVRVFGWLLVGIAAMSLFATLLQAAEERRAELALMRVLGATPARLALLTLAEAAALGVVSIAVGIAFTKLVACWVVGNFTPSGAHLEMPVMGAEHLVLYAVILIVALAAALAPAVKAYRVSILQSLTR